MDGQNYQLGGDNGGLLAEAIDAHTGSSVIPLSRFTPMNKIECYNVQRTKLSPLLGYGQKHKHQLIIEVLKWSRS